MGDDYRAEYSIINRFRDAVLDRKLKKLANA